METNSSGRAHGLFVLGITLAVGMIVSTYIAGRSIERVKLANQTIRVKGSSERRIASDWAVWEGRFYSRAKDLVLAYDKLQKDLASIYVYLDRNGIKKESVALSSVSTSVLYKLTEKGVSTNEIDGYLLEQSLEIKSADIPLVARLSRESTSLIKEGIEFTSYQPRYFYTKINDLKIQLLGEATKDAKARAEQLALSSGSRVGVLRSAAQGVFQITPPNSTEISDSGVYDTSSIEKAVKAVVTADFSIQ
ncbi:MAG: SIMPL domain-containing protein [Candidatus Aureabacteria bacterium]|nr:SIMPL domain-containing protein [Candidatus Auribacterota bacterium]